MNKGIASMRKVILFGLGLGLATMVAPAERPSMPASRCTLWSPTPPARRSRATLTGEADVHQVFRSTKNDNGLFQIDALQVLQGTATDSDGNQYVFHDIDHFVINDSATSPQAQPPYVLKGNGQGCADKLGIFPNIKLNMFVYIQVNAHGSIVDLGSVFEGDISCDPSSEL